MTLETILRILAILAGVILISTNFISIDYILAKFLPKKNKPVNPSPDSTSEDDVKFLHIINLWYQLKDNCGAYGLHLAVDKIDEVFPLLNKKDEVSNV